MQDQDQVWTKTEKVKVTTQTTKGKGKAKGKGGLKSVHNSTSASYRPKSNKKYIVHPRPRMWKNPHHSVTSVCKSWNDFRDHFEKSLPFLSAGGNETRVCMIMNLGLIPCHALHASQRHLTSWHDWRNRSIGRACDVGVFWLRASMGWADNRPAWLASWLKNGGSSFDGFFLMPKSCMDGWLPIKK
jgi:hypothetical protein